MRRASGYLAAGRERLVDKAVRPYHAAFAEGHALADDGVWANIASVADAGRGVLVGRCAAAQSPLHGIVRVNLNARGNGAMAADAQTARAVEHCKWAYPSIGPYHYIAEYKGRIVNARALAKTEVAGFFPTVGKQFVGRQNTVVLLPHLCSLFLEKEAEGSV